MQRLFNELLARNIDLPHEADAVPTALPRSEGPAGDRALGSMVPQRWVEQPDTGPPPPTPANCSRCSRLRPVLRREYYNDTRASNPGREHLLPPSSAPPAVSMQIPGTLDRSDDTGSRPPGPTPTPHQRHTVLNQSGSIRKLTGIKIRDEGIRGP
jgi:hypothetical protein